MAIRDLGNRAAQHLQKTTAAAATAMANNTITATQFAEFQSAPRIEARHVEMATQLSNAAYKASYAARDAFKEAKAAGAPRSEVRAHRAAADATRSIAKDAGALSKLLRREKSFGDMMVTGKQAVAAGVLPEAILTKVSDGILRPATMMAIVRVAHDANANGTLEKLKPFLESARDFLDVQQWNLIRKLGEIRLPWDGTSWGLFGEAAVGFGVAGAALGTVVAAVVAILKGNASVLLDGAAIGASIGVLTTALAHGVDMQGKRHALQDVANGVFT